jgi:hypothetical protein
MFRTFVFRRWTALLIAAGLGLTLVAGGTGKAVAGAAQKAERKAGKQGKQVMGAKLKEVLGKLGLSEEQKGRIRALEATYQNEFVRLRDGSDDKQVRQEKVKALRQKMRGDLLAVLTDDQRARLKEEMKQVRAAQKKAKAEAKAKTKADAKVKKADAKVKKADAKVKKTKAKSSEDAA